MKRPLPNGRTELSLTATELLRKLCQLITCAPLVVMLRPSNQLLPKCRRRFIRAPRPASRTPAWRSALDRMCLRRASEAGALEAIPEAAGRGARRLVGLAEAVLEARSAVGATTAARVALLVTRVRALRATGTQRLNAATTRCPPVHRIQDTLTRASATLPRGHLRRQLPPNQLLHRAHVATTRTRTDRDRMDLGLLRLSHRNQ